MPQNEDVAMDEYQWCYLRWEYCPRWRVLSRMYWKAEWKLWLRAAMHETQQASIRQADIDRANEKDYWKPEYQRITKEDE